jgi:hypothetical protein
MGQIDVADGKPPGHKRHISRVELFLDPVRPDPVQIMTEFSDKMLTFFTERREYPIKLRKTIC